MVPPHPETVPVWWRCCGNQQGDSLEMRLWGGGSRFPFHFVFLTVKLKEIKAYLNWVVVWDVPGRRGSSVRAGLWYRAALLPWFSNEMLLSH